MSSRKDRRSITHTDEQTASQTIPVVEEVAHVGKRIVERSRYRIDRTIEMHEQTVDQMLREEHVEIERREVNRLLPSDEIPDIRREGDDLTIVPVVEEVLVVEKRLMLREEVLIRRTRNERPVSQKVALRRQKVSVTRNPGGTGDGGDATPEG